MSATAASSANTANQEELSGCGLHVRTAPHGSAWRVRPCWTWRLGSCGTARSPWRSPTATASSPWPLGGRRACGSDPTPTGHRGSGAGANGLADPAGRKGRGAQGAASETWWRSGQPGMVCVSRIRGGRYFKYRPPPVSFVTVRSDLHGSDWA